MIMYAYFMLNLCIWLKNEANKFSSEVIFTNSSIHSSLANIYLIKANNEDTRSTLLTFFKRFFC